MKKNIATLFYTVVLLNLGCSCLFAEPTPSKETPITKAKSKEKKNAEEVKDTILKDFLAGTPYLRDSFKKLPSPFRNLITFEKIKIKKEEEIIKKKREEAELRDNTIILDPLNPTKELSSDPKIKELVLVSEARKSMEMVIQLVELKKYDDAEAKLIVMDAILFKNNVETYRDEISKKKAEVSAEHSEWDEINKIIEGLTVDAMFIAEGKKKIALINDVTVEEGDDLNDLLGLNRTAPIVLTFVSSNSIKIKFKNFTLQKELIDND